MQHHTQFEVSLGFGLICWAHILFFKATRVRDASGMNPNSICGHNSASLDKALGKVEPLGSLGSSPLEGMFGKHRVQVLNLYIYIYTHEHCRQHALFSCSFSRCFTQTSPLNQTKVFESNANSCMISKRGEHSQPTQQP